MGSSAVGATSGAGAAVSTGATSSTGTATAVSVGADIIIAETDGVSWKGEQGQNDLDNRAAARLC